MRSMASIWLALLAVGGMASVSGQAYTASTPIAHVRDDAVFGGYGRLVFPVDEGYMGGSTLGTLRLAWYNGIDSDETVKITNYLHDEAASGRQVFYDIYTDEEKRQDSSKRDTGLFFFKGNKGQRTAIVNAGGGFAYVGDMQDSFPHALALCERGYNAFALIYRPNADTACQDLSRAIAFLYSHQAELGISMEDYSLWGGSAGARMAAWVGTYGTAAFGESQLPQSAAVIMEYTGLGEVTGGEPPTYAVVGTGDWIASWRVMERRIERIKENGTDAEIEVFDGLPHGFGLGLHTIAEGWIDRAVAFWMRQIGE